MHIHVACNNWLSNMNMRSIVCRGLLPIHYKYGTSVAMKPQLKLLLLPVFGIASVDIILVKAMALTGKLEADVEIKASPERFHDMFSNKPHHVHHTCYDKIQGCELHDGEWGKDGSVLHWSYVHDGAAKKAKVVAEAIDPAKNLITFRVIEGDLMNEYKSFVVTIQASPNSGGGSVVHWMMEYEKLHEGIAHPETLLQFAVDVSKDIDKHLCQAN